VRRHLTLLRADGEPERLDLPGPALAGGGPADAVRIAGAPAGAAALVPRAAGVVVEARVDGVRAAGHPLAAGARRLLRPGERLEVAGARVEVGIDAGVASGTRAAAGALLQLAAAGEDALAEPHLLVLSGATAGERLSLAGAPTVGRGAAADLRLDDAHASRVHAAFRLRGGEALVEDLGSKNGVRVNGARIRRGERRLLPGDEVSVGGTILAYVDPLAVPARGAAAGAALREGRTSAWWAAAALLAASATALALAA
jgi:hypothetical protein